MKDVLLGLKVIIELMLKREGIAIVTYNHKRVNNIATLLSGTVNNVAY